MKIEVTFDRTAKKEFREQCVKRLQNFVQHIKTKDIKAFNPRNTNCVNYEQQPIDTLRLKFQQIVKEKESGRNGYYNDNVSKKGKEVKKFILPQAKVNVREVASMSKVQKQKQRNFGEECGDGEITQFGQRFSMAEMKLNVDKILKKLNKNEKIESQRQRYLQQKIEITNQKLDEVLSFLQDKKVMCSNVQSICASQLFLAQNQEKGNDEFFQKFDYLAKKYEAVKHRSHRNSNRTNRESKSIFEETAESVTFRHGNELLRRNA